MTLIALSGESFDDLFPKWHRWIRKLSWRFAKSLQLECEDVHQELILTIATKFGIYDSSRCNFGTYIGWVSRGLYFLMKERKRRSVRELNLIVLGERDHKDLLQVIVDEDAEVPSDAADRREAIERIRREVRRLPGPLRECVEGYYEMSGREKPRRTNGEQLARAMSQLRRKLCSCG